MEEPRHDLIAHLREQIEQDPERYANDAKLWVSSGILVVEKELTSEDRRSI